MIAVVPLAVVLSLATGGTASARGAPVRRALVVAYNGSSNPSTPPLRFADDDGLLWAETLERLGVQTTLLTVADADTARTEPRLLALAHPPTLSAVTEAVAGLHAVVQKEHAVGREVDVLFVYVGHGATDAMGKSSLTLVDASLDRVALYAQLDRLGADFVHVLVDACNAAGVLGIRGADPEVLGRLRAVLDQEKLGARPTLGAIFADSADGETHEWSQIRAGLFSHAARSGLMGAADVNGDGVVEYSELDAFVAASLAGVKSVKTGLSARTLPPSADPHRGLVGPAPRGPLLQLSDTDSEGEGRYSIEDELGARLADLHRAAGETVRLALPPRESYWLRTPQGEARVTQVELGRGPPKLSPLAMTRRGPMEESVRRGFFAVPFGRPFYEGYVASAGLVSVRFQGPVPSQARALDNRTLGLGLSAQVAKPTLGAGGAAGGFAVAWRTRLSRMTVGAQLAWSLAPEASLWSGKANIQRVSAMALAGVAGPWRLSPLGELGAGWLLVAASRESGVQGDSLGLTARATVGARWQGARVGFRAGAFLDADEASIAGARKVFFAPGAEIGVEL